LKDARIVLNSCSLEVRALVRNALAF